MAIVSLNSEFSKESYRANMDAINAAFKNLNVSSTKTLGDEILSSNAKLLMRIYDAHTWLPEQFDSMYVDVFTDDSGIDYTKSSGIIHRGSANYDVIRGGTYSIDSQSEYQDGTFTETTLGGSSSVPQTTLQTDKLFGYWTSDALDCLGVSSYGSLSFTKSTHAQSVFSNDSDTIALYRLNETSGTTASDETGNHDGTASSASIWNTGGKFSGCAFCNHAYYVVIADHANFNPNNIVIDFWHNPTANGALDDYEIVSKWNETANSREWHVRFQDGHYQFGASTDGTSGNVSTVNSDTVLAGNWHFVRAVADGTNLLLYVNGMLQGTNSWANNIYDGTAAVIIGGRDDNAGGASDLARGYIDEVRISEYSATNHTAAATKALYHTTNVRYVTRSGGTSSPDSTWQDWKPNSSTVAIDACDSISDWATSDSTNLALSLDTTLEQEGTGCIKIAGTVNSCAGESCQRSNYGGIDISGKDYLHFKARSSITGEHMRLYLANTLPVLIEDVDPLSNGTFVNGQNGWTTSLTTSGAIDDYINVNGKWLQFHHGTHFGAMSMEKSIPNTPSGEIDFWFYPDSDSTSHEMRLIISESGTDLIGSDGIRLTYANPSTLGVWKYSVNGGTRMIAAGQTPVNMKLVWKSGNLYDLYGNGQKIETDTVLTNNMTSGVDSIKFEFYSNSNDQEDRYIGRINSRCLSSDSTESFGRKYIDIDIEAADTWQDFYWDLSDLQDDEKDTLQGIVLQCTSDSSAFEFYIDDIEGIDGYDTATTIQSMPSRYLQTRGILTTTSENTSPTLLNTTILYNTSGSSDMITDAISIDYYPERIFITADETLNSGTITYYASRDGGTTWTQAEKDEWTWVGGQPSGSTIRIKAVIGVDAQLDNLAIAWSK